MKLSLEKRIIRSFIDMNIPTLIRDLVVNDWDLMDCYEELFNYSQALLNNKHIDFNQNSTMTGKAFVFDNEYKNILVDLSNKEDLEIQTYCHLTLAVLSILKKHAYTLNENCINK